VFFTIPGREANEARSSSRANTAPAKGGAYEIITFEGGFHGRTLATFGVGQEGVRTAVEPKVSGFRKAKLTISKSVKQLISRQHRRCDAGADPGRSRRLARERRILRSCGADQGSRACCLIFDEIQTASAAPENCSTTSRPVSSPRS